MKALYNDSYCSLLLSSYYSTYNDILMANYIPTYVY